MGNEQTKIEDNSAVEKPNWGSLQHLSQIKSYERAWDKLPTVIGELLKLHDYKQPKRLGKTLNFICKYATPETISAELCKVWTDKLVKLGFTRFVSQIFVKLWDPSILSKIESDKEDEKSAVRQWNQIEQIGYLCYNISDSSADFCRDILSASAVEYLMKVLKTDDFQVDKVNTSDQRTSFATVFTMKF